jgi:hypothetical protein
MILLGNDKNNGHTAVSLSDEARYLGSYVIGTTGTGKSTFLKSLILQDINEKKGVAVLDPHGDLVEDILACMPDHRLDDVILFDPADIEYPFGLNVLACDRSDPRQRDLVTSMVMDTLYKLFHASWGPRMEDLLRHSIQTLLYQPSTTLLELLMILTDFKRRQDLKQPACEADPILKHFWEQQFPESYTDKYGQLIAPREQTELIGSSLNKIGRFLVNPVIRNIVAQPQNSVDLRQVMDEGKVLLVNLSKGGIGADNSSFLGSVLVNQFLLAALSRRDIPFEKRRPFYLYVDEYQNFATESFPQLQSEARKFAIVTTVAHQYRDQLDESNKGSTLNVANLFVFRVSGKDSVELAGQFDNTPYQHPPQYQPILTALGNDLFVQAQTAGSGTSVYRELEGVRETYSDTHLETANILAMLPQHQAIVRVLDEKSKELKQYRLATRPFSCQPQPAKTNFIRQSSRLLARPSAELEADIRQRMTSEVPLAPASDFSWREIEGE